MINCFCWSRSFGAVEDRFLVHLYPGMIARCSDRPNFFLFLLQIEIFIFAADWTETLVCFHIFTDYTNYCCKIKFWVIYFWFETEMQNKMMNGKFATGTPSLGWSCVMIVCSLLGGASIVHNICKPSLVSFLSFFSVAICDSEGLARSTS